MKLPDHLFVASSDGALHDTREPNWSSHPLRPNYRWTHREIKTVADLKATLRNGAYAWPGGYPMYFLCSDGEALSFTTVRKEFAIIARAIQNNDRTGWRVAYCDVNWENCHLYDDHTGERIESAYGDNDDAEEDAA